jgi:hypothetical protein
LLDARVAEAAEAWLNDPADVGAYERLVAAVEERRGWLRRGDQARSDHDDPDRGQNQAGRGQDDADVSHDHADLSQDRADRADPSPRHLDGPTDVAKEAADPEHEDAESWPNVRAVGADLVGDPAAVLRRLRGG